MTLQTDPTLRFLEDLVSIDSVNPSLVPGARGEEQIARVHHHRLVTDDAHLVRLVDAGDTHLPRAQLGDLAGDFEAGFALEDEEDLVPQVMAVALGNRPRLHAQETRANLWCDENVADVGSVVENLQCHRSLPVS